MAEEEKPFDAGDEQQVRQRKSKAKLIREREINNLRQVLSTREGRNVIWNILAYGNIYSENPGGPDFSIGKFEGKRALAIWLIQEIFTADPNAYTIMRDEAEKSVSNQ